MELKQSMDSLSAEYHMETAGLGLQYFIGERYQYACIYGWQVGTTLWTITLPLALFVSSPIKQKAPIDIIRQFGYA